MMVVLMMIFIVSLTLKPPSPSALFDPLNSPWFSQVALAVKNPPARAGDVRDEGSSPRLRISPGGGHGNPLQYSCLENPMDREARGAAVHGSQKVGHN